MQMLHICFWKQSCFHYPPPPRSCYFKLVCIYKEGVFQNEQIFSFNRQLCTVVLRDVDKTMKHPAADLLWYQKKQVYKRLASILSLGHIIALILDWKSMETSA